jgi:MFS transporter, ACS family, tartrate transporter
MTTTFYDAADPAQRATMRKVLRRIVPFLLLIYAFAYLDRINIGTAALTMNKALGLTQAEYGFAAGIFFLGYLIFEIPSNYAMSKLGGRVWFARILISWGVISMATGAVQNATQLSIVRILLGIAEAGSFPGIMYFIALWFPREMRARVQVLCMLPLAIVLGTPLSAAILQYMNGMFGLEGWRLLFILEGLPPVVLGFVTLKYLTSRPMEAGWLSDAERRWLTSVSLNASTDADPKASIWSVMRNVQVIVFALAYSGLMMGFSANLFFTPQIIAAFGKLIGAKLTFVQIGLLTSLPACLALLISYSWARHSDRTGERVWHAAFGAIGAGIGLVLLANSSGFPMLLLGLTLLSGCISGGATAIWQLPIRGMSDRRAAIAFAFVNSIAVVFSALIPYAVGTLTDRTGSYMAALYMIVGIMVVSAVLVVFGGTVLERRRAELPLVPVGANPR